MAAKRLPDLTTLNKLLICDPEAGLLFWKRRPLDMFPTVNVCACWNGRYADKPAFQVRSKLGYLYGEIGGERHLAHRVIWKMATGEDAERLDHINGVTTENGIANLRPATHSENMRNRKLSANSPTGVNGVDIVNGRFRCRVNYDGRTHHIGMFDTIDKARAARKMADKRLKFSERHGE